MERIRTTHTGSLPRPAPIVAAIAERERGGPPLDPDAVRDAVAGCVRRQVETGLDVVNDGELAKISYVTYVRGRLTGFEPVETPWPRPNPALDGFPEYAERLAGRGGFREVRIPVCRGDVTYPDTSTVEADITTLQAAATDAGAQVAFLTAASPGVIAMFMRDEHYGDRTAYLIALAEAMKTEYDAVHRAGLVLQVDCPDLAASRAEFPDDAEGLRAFRGLVEENVAALNRALRDVPPERVRLHMCWGNYEGPHHRDVALRDVLDIVLTARAGTISFEGANPRHGHEWTVFDEVALPDDRVIMPGVIDTTTNFVEHPELVAQRIGNYARLVGPDRVLPATDCGLATVAVGEGGVDPRIAWAKLRSLVEGAALASR
ncbi:cobalamin-independent methionine synthase II family protein [Pseudonocardia xinjiangensis]|uniref:Cobalamin-independent methionine synthase II family protein n=1 Tax=Pseudonocardia xinjiangensis TaxID=75289 RepID=A0ABX1RI93_9PSEU|nr:cobalamin-independent methionine synthase II family protein [Pseudonocardia xinjiangensis]NMH79644.1 cobalamin-independent methionine synthase II family protein [Pseudonocardia xinjiangensis]